MAKLRRSSVRKKTVEQAFTCSQCGYRQAVLRLLRLRFQTRAVFWCIACSKQTLHTRSLS